MITSTRPSTLFWRALLCLLLGQLIFAANLSRSNPTFIAAGIGLHILGCVLGARSFAYTRATAQDRMLDWQPSRATQAWCIVALAVLAGALRIIWLDVLPFKVDGDAAAFATGAANFLKPNPPPIIGTGWQSHTNLYFWIVSRMLRLFGRTIIGMRSLSAVGGTLGVVAVFALGASLWHFRVGLFAALVMTVLPFDLVFSRVGTEVIHLTWLVPVTILCIWEGWRRQSLWWFMLGGVVTGLSQYFYPGARLIPILGAAQIGLLTLFPPPGSPASHRLSERLKDALWMGLAWAGGAVLVYGPMIAYFMQHPDAYTARLKLVSITSSGWLQQQLKQHPWWQVIGWQVWRAYLPFHYPVDGARLWFLGRQYLGPIDAALLTLGLLGVAFNRQTRPCLPLWLRLYIACYLLGGIVLAGVLTIDTPMPSRYMIFVPIIALLIAYALEHALRHALLLGSAKRSLVLSVAGAALAVYSSLNAQSYVRHDTEAIWTTDLTSQTATYAARYLMALPDQNYNILYAQTPIIYYQASPALPFLTNKPGTNIKEPLSCTVLAQSNAQPGDVLIAPQGRIDELRQMQAQLGVNDVTVLRNPKGEEMVGIVRLLAARAGGRPICVDPPSAVQ